MRPGRFDRQIPVTNPDLAGREQILRVHAKDKPLGPDVDLNSLAKRTAGMSGADLANVLNEAALLTARVDGNIITADALEEATDRVVGGPRRTSKIISEHEKKVTAYHEGGHTLAAWAMKDIERVYKVTILARGRTGGHAMTASEDDKEMYTRAELFARLVFAMGGRSGEELIFGSPTTGASADIEQATKIARAMVTEYGMSPDLGAVKYGEEQGDPFSGRGGGGTLDYSNEVAATIDKQVRFLIEKAHDEAYAILKENRDILDVLAQKLLEKETLRRPDLEAIFKDVKPRERLEIFTKEDALHPKDDKDPVKTPVELARERGEEPPKRQDFLEASRQARREREAAAATQATPSADQDEPRTNEWPVAKVADTQNTQATASAGSYSHPSENNQAGSSPEPASTQQGSATTPASHQHEENGWRPGSTPVAPQGHHNGTQTTEARGHTYAGYDEQTAVIPRPHSPGHATSYPDPQPHGTTNNHGTPVYGGTPPPAGWTAPGWPPSGQVPRYVGSADPTASHPEQRAGNAPGNAGQHPGMQNYGFGQENNDTDRGLHGFRLPDSERPDHPWTDGDSNSPQASTDGTHGSDPASGGHRREDGDQ